MASLVSCFFVHAYSWTCSACYGHVDLPIANAILHNAGYAYAVPVVILLLGLLLLWSTKDRTVAIECVNALAWLSAFAWALTAILFWQVSQIRISSGAMP